MGNTGERGQIDEKTPSLPLSYPISHDGRPSSPGSRHLAEGDRDGRRKGELRLGGDTWTGHVTDGGKTTTNGYSNETEGDGQQE